MRRSIHDAYLLGDAPDFGTPNGRNVQGLVDAAIVLTHELHREPVLTKPFKTSFTVVRLEES
jgi:hypothetical protein